MLHLYLFSTVCYFNADCSSELANCMPPFLLWTCCANLFTFSHSYFVHLSNARVNQYLHFLSLTLVNSGTLFLCLFFHLPMTLWKEECQDNSHVKLDLHPLRLFLLLSFVQGMVISGIFFFFFTNLCLPMVSNLLMQKRKTNTIYATIIMKTTTKISITITRREKKKSINQILPFSVKLESIFEVPITKRLHFEKIHEVP